MTRIGLISDTHGWLDDNALLHFRDCDEIWHAGDFGTMEVAQSLAVLKPLKGVYGNIDGMDIRNAFPLTQHWTCEEVSIMMTHIGGYPGHYKPGIKKEIQFRQPKLFISGHSHILKVMYDEQLQCLHINPGAAGRQGWHKMRTIVRFAVDGEKIRDLEVIELGKRGV